MDDRYYVFVRPDKRFRLPGNPNPRFKQILEHIDFLRTYYRFPLTTYVDHSTPHFFSVDISSGYLDIRLYLNNDAAGSVDVSVPGMGIVRDVPAETIFIFLQIFHNLSTPEEIWTILRD